MSKIPFDPLEGQPSRHMPKLAVGGLDPRSPEATQLLETHAAQIKQFYLGMSRQHKLGIVDQTKGTRQVGDDITLEYINQFGRETVRVTPTPKKQPVKPVPEPLDRPDYAIIDFIFRDSNKVPINVHAYVSNFNHSEATVFSSSNWSWFNPSLSLQPEIKFLDYDNDYPIARVETIDSNNAASLLVDMSRMPDDITLRIKIFAKSDWARIDGPPTFDDKLWVGLQTINTTITSEVITGPVPTCFLDTASSTYNWQLTDQESSAGPDTGTHRPDDDLPYRGVGGYEEAFPASVYYQGRNIYPDPDLVTYDGTSTSYNADEHFRRETYLGPCGLGNFFQERDTYYRRREFTTTISSKSRKYGDLVGFVDLFSPYVDIYARMYPRNTEFEPINDIAWESISSQEDELKVLWSPVGAEWQLKQKIGESAVLNELEDWVELGAIPATEEHPQGFPYIGDVVISRSKMKNAGSIGFEPADA